MQIDPEYIDDGSSFLEISPLTLRPEHLATFSLFARYELGHKEKRKHIYRCLLTDADSLSKENAINILQSWESVYIHKSQKGNFKQYLINNLDYILNNDALEIEERVETLTAVSTEVVRDAFTVNFGSKGVDKKIFKRLENLISQAVGFISDINSLTGVAKLAGHDYNTHTHSVKVGWLVAVFINANKDLFPIKSHSELNTLLIHATVAGFLHDIGKVKIPRSILSKRGRLDDLECVTVQAHTAYSLALLFETDLPHAVMQGILYHHENEDGSGYPGGILGNEIPLLAKVTHIVDVFDAITSRRPYKEPKTPFEALKIMANVNPHVDTLNRLEEEVRENIKVPIVAMIRDEKNEEVQREKEQKIIQQAADNRVKVRSKLRDMGMAHCFDQQLLVRFISTLNKSESFDLDPFSIVEGLTS